jgi:hypothetical protein
MNMLQVCRVIAMGMLIVTGGVTPTIAAGALAVGDCGAYGASARLFGQSAARTNALKMCATRGGRNCQLQVDLAGNCASLAVERGRFCGVLGWATANTLNSAQSEALKDCASRGGRNCSIQDSICD